MILEGIYQRCLIHRQRTFAPVFLYGTPHVPLDLTKVLGGRSLVSIFFIISLFLFHLRSKYRLHARLKQHAHAPIPPSETR